MVVVFTNSRGLLRMRNVQKKRDAKFLRKIKYQIVDTFITIKQYADSKYDIRASH